MRDPERIPATLELLRVAWERNPDLRLTQLIWNLRDMGATSTEVVSRFYNMEDDVLSEKIRVQYLDIDPPDMVR